MAERGKRELRAQPADAGRPAKSPFAYAVRQSVRVDGRRYRLFEKTRATLRYVDGALPWRATAGDTFDEATFIAPPRILTAERSSDGDELELFEGTLLETRVVWGAFSRTDPPPRPGEMHPAQPIIRSRSARAFLFVAEMLLLINLGGLLWSLAVEGDPVFSQTLSVAQAKQGITSEPFTLPDTNILRVHVDTDMQNAWLVPQVAFVNDQDQAVADTWLEIAYYTGVASDGRWDEGSRDGDEHVRAPPAGTYRLLLQANGEVSRQWLPSYARSLTVSVYAGDIPSTFFVAGLVLALLPVAAFVFRNLRIEHKRWNL